MNRELKFRSYNNFEKKFIYSDWKYGMVSFWDCALNNFNKEYEYPQQYNGLKDKNGKGIYEGDIVKTFWQHDGVNNYDYDFLGQITFSNDFLQFGIFGDRVFGTVWYPLCSFEREELFTEETEVVGNIYQNKDILK